ncbi:MAG: hypothetical protein OJF50_000946 [Nitrospira sp.]|jgi:hypothetical protein|nr:hypothetical protein [Nitrospira sp.]
MPKQSFRNKPQRSQMDVSEALRELAKHVDDRAVFLNLAKEAWNTAHYDAVPKRGKPSFEEKCLQAIIEGLDELGIAHVVSANYTSCADPMFDVVEEIIPNPYQQLPQGRLVRMILDRVPGIKLSTARKYARIWERDTAPPKELSTRRTHGMTLYNKMKKDLPVLYRNRTPRR